MLRITMQDISTRSVQTGIHLNSFITIYIDVEYIESSYILTYIYVMKPSNMLTSKFDTEVNSALNVNFGTRLGKNIYFGTT